ncbi:hypothetical protein CTA1_4898 [Colletotrichum tanaceti]|uniref:Uncharacterized protein n=1 Tax=Colletotrichum tanaceti TaxID=1306861 RepID=A0A4U6XW63_9PEZI|nr:hypothetical protein CTA1_4898 [Colletotrichum tanaceti]
MLRCKSAGCPFKLTRLDGKLKSFTHRIENRAESLQLRLHVIFFLLEFRECEMAEVAVGRRIASRA